MSRAFQKEIRSSIRKGWKRFISILTITTLGVGMMTGLYVACKDMYYSADHFFDGQNLFDIQILSTLGLTQEDVDILSDVEGIEKAEGIYIETVHTKLGSEQKSADMTVLNHGSINLPLILSGSLPTKSGEIAVTQIYLDESGKNIGDQVSIQEISQKETDTDDSNTHSDRSSTFSISLFTITGIVLDPRDISNKSDSGNSFRSTITSDYTFFITEEDADTDIYTAVYLILNNTRDMNCYSKQYKDKILSATSNIESQIKAQREQARYTTIFREAHTKIADAEMTMNAEFEKADNKLANAWQEIYDARQELLDQEKQLINNKSTAEEKINAAREKLETALHILSEAEIALSNGEETLFQSEKELLSGDKELAVGKNKLLNAERELNDGEVKLTLAEDQLESGTLELTQGEAELNTNAASLILWRQQFESERSMTLSQLFITEQLLTETQDQIDTSFTQLETELAVLKNSLGAPWPETEWNILVDAVTALSKNGADDSAIIAGTTTETSALVAMITAANPTLANINTFLDSTKQTAIGLGKTYADQQILDSNQEVYAIQKSATLQQLELAEADLIYREKQLSDARTLLEVKRAELFAAKIRLSSERAKLVDGISELNLGWEEWNRSKDQLGEAWIRWQNGKSELDAKRIELEKGKAEISDGLKVLNQEAVDADLKISDALEQITQGKEDLTSGESTLTKKEQDYQDKKKEAQQKIEESFADLKELDMTEWYIQDRTSLDSYASLDSDLSSIEAIGNIFPLIFLLIAVLMSLTSMTRLVEEERSLIGTFKSLGFGNADIYWKYVSFAFSACLSGGVLGDVFGFIIMPNFLMILLKSLYSFPQYFLRFDALYGIGAVILFMAAIIGATMLACRSELVQMPATLLRPKTPRSGSRVWLEHIPFIWNRLRFLDKVTVRNLFRFKKRLLMTIGGIMGCTALIICGYAIKDSVLRLAPYQYNTIYQYDLLAVFNEKDYDTSIQKLTNDGNIHSILNLRIESIKLINKNGESVSAQLMVIPSGESIEEYIQITDSEGTNLSLDEHGIIVTENATRILDLNVSNPVSLQTLELEQYNARVSGIARNYLGNNVYMTQKLYESLAGSFKPNGALFILSDSCTDPSSYAESLLNQDSVISAVSTDSLRNSFGFDLINAVVLLLIVMAGSLAFVVLFTLSNTNISERVRELATIKVLGFFDQEVYQYVNKETLILTVIGILIGLPAGRILSGLLLSSLVMPSIHFAVYIKPFSYLVSATLTLLFAIINNLITNRSLDRINMVEALKSVE
ncbi:MAG: hypothetical protein PHT21_09340 [Lachnospiraceae bacterium]|nr:hypothetical protein [Lachnospiraceae bacterium]